MALMEWNQVRMILRMNIKPEYSYILQSKKLYFVLFYSDSDLNSVQVMKKILISTEAYQVGSS